MSNFKLGRMRGPLQFFTWTGSTLCMSAALSLLSAPQIEAAVLEETMVTARKRSESLQDTPVAIQVIGNEQIESLAAQDLSRIVESVNNVDVTPGSSGAGGNFRIRGISASSADAGIESSVTVNIDGVQTGRGHIARIPMFDLQSVQVLKGPQALYFGKDSPAGVIAVTSALPTDEFEMRVQLSYENEAEETILDGYISGPLTETLNGRLAIRLSDSNGWIDNQAQFLENSDGHLVPFEPYDFPGAKTTPGAEENYSARLTLDWQPSDSFRATARLLNNNIHSEGFNASDLAECGALGPSVAMFGAPAPVLDPYANCKLDRKASHGSLPQEIADNWHPSPMIDMTSDGRLFATLDTWLASLNLEWQRDWGVINSVTGYYAYDYNELGNFGSLTLGSNFLGFHPEDHDQWTQELRFLTQFDGPFNIMGGVYYETFDRERTTATKIASIGFDPITGYSNSATVIQNTEGDTYSAFGEVTWDISDTWTLSAGARYTHDEKEGEQYSSYVHYILVAAGIFSPANTLIDADFTDDQVSPEVTLTWQPSEDLTVWGAYKTGYKSGGFSVPAVLTSNFTSESSLFDPEEAEGFELGFKSMLMDRRVRFNATAYYYEFTDLQVTVLDTETTSFTIDNAAASTTYGIEFDAQYLVSENLSLRAEAGYNIAEYDEFPAAQCYRNQPVGPNECTDINGDGKGDSQDLAGERWDMSPKLAGSLGFDYSRPLGNDWLLHIAGEGIYTGDMITSSVHLPEAESDDFWRVNARIGLVMGGKWEFALIGRNLTDEKGIGAGTRPGAPTAQDRSGALLRKELLFQAAYQW